MRSTKAFLIGFGTAYLLDPHQGRRRRAVARDRIMKSVRRTGRLAQKKARFTGGRLQGLGARARALVRHRAVAFDDRTVEQRIRSSALRDVGLTTSEVDVEVERGVATLRGSVTSRSLADDLVTRVEKVPGVRDVAAMIRVTAEGQ
ncbi:MAG TPA: BON domain-containing protein [Gaiellaceae bacterium]|nr:BON domain-containing protein [Gaiellaceae bacterium]